MEATLNNANVPGKVTLAGRLIASGNIIQTSQINEEKLTEMTEDQLSDIMENLDSMEREYFDRVGRRLNTILDAVRDAKNVAKPVQVALAEAIAAFKQATGARNQRLAVMVKLKSQHQR